MKAWVAVAIFTGLVVTSGAGWFPLLVIAAGIGVVLLASR